MVAEVNTQSPETLSLSGEVSADNVVALRNKGEGIIKHMPSESAINLAGLTSANTITLSLLLSWIRYAREKSVSLTIVQSPNQLFDMARVSGLEQILPFESARI